MTERRKYSRREITPGLKRYHELVLARPGQLVDPAEVLDHPSREIVRAFKEVHRLAELAKGHLGTFRIVQARIDAEAARRDYNTMLAQAVMDENPITLHKRGEVPKALRG